LRALTFATVLLCACGWKSDGLARLEELYPTPVPPSLDAGPITVIDIGTPKCSGFEGRWAMRLVQNGTISPVGEEWKIQVNDLFLADSDGLSFSLRFCDQQSQITTPSGATDLGRTKASDVMKTAIAKTPIQIPLPSNGTFGATNIVWTWGLRGLTAPLTEVLPTKDNYTTDARVWDQDEDGKPGVTLQVVAPAGDRYMVRRSVWNFATGKLTFDNQWISGTLDSVISENGLGATNMLLLTPAPITPKAEGTRYEIRCVGETYTCASLSKDSVQLFRDAP
jgi:hypothetical protein